MARVDGRKNYELRPVIIRRGFTQSPAGSVLIETGNTRVLCTATVEESVPPWREASGLGWVTAEYDMLPSSTGQRRKRDRGGKIDGRTQEIQRLIGRSLRAVVDMAKLGPRSIWIDCDVLQADGGTRTASITGAYVALADAINVLREKGSVRANPLTDSVAAVSVGLVGTDPRGGRAGAREAVLLDLCYVEDVRAVVDFNVVMTGRGRFVEVQGAAEAGTFDADQMAEIIKVARTGLGRLRRMQMKALRDG